MTWRLRLLSAAIVGLWTVVALRLMFIQAWRHDDFAALAVRQQRYVETIPARPGDLLDRTGRLLATTVKVRSLYVDPSRLQDPAETARALAAALQLDADQLTAHVAAHRDGQFLWIKRRLSEDEEQRLLALELPQGAWGLREEFQRRYPHRHLAAHVLGWRDIDGVGRAGVERSLADRLAGVDGQRTLVRDARGYVLDVLEEVTQPPVHGDAVRLTIDLELQTTVERRLDRLVNEWRASSACVVVLDPRNGEVLAMSSRPTFNPNAPADSLPETWVNTAISRAYEPGSTLKPLIAAWTLHRGIIHRDDTFDCGNGSYQMGSRLLHDSHPHGRLDVSGILVKSSNIGMAHIGEQLGNSELFAALQEFGLGRPTGIELPGESRGIVRPLNQWDHYSTGSIPMGQEIAATPVQMIRAHAALANGGWLITPHLLAPQTAAGSPANVVVRRVLDESTARWIVQQPLVDVVTSGTARRARIEGVEVFAKTGTAQKFDSDAGAYANDRYVSSCVCGAPAKDPQALVLVLVDEAVAEGDAFGGLVAAPAAADILRTALGRVSPTAPLAVKAVKVAPLGKPQ